ATFLFASRRRHTRSKRDWSSDVCSSDLGITTHGLEGVRSILNPQPALERGHFGGHDAAGLLQGALALFLGRINNLAQVVDGVQVQVFERCDVDGYVSCNRQN